MKSAEIEITAARAAVTVTVNEDEIRRVLKAMGAKGFSVCLDLEKAFDWDRTGLASEIEVVREAMFSLISACFDHIRDTVACEDGVVYE